MKVLLDIRNHCAHGGVLYDLALPAGKKNMEPADYQGLYGALRVVLYMIGNVSKNRQQDLKNELRELFEQNTDVREILTLTTGIRDIDTFLED